jgi:metal-responsive CopG/Arc/MetJ family transcriptional regulator
MSDLMRTQVLLEKQQRSQLDNLAREKGISFSELVRDFLNAQLRVRAYEEMRRAAEQLYDDYANDQELTAMTALDGEDFNNG